MMGRAETVARWIAEAIETGNPLAPLPPDIAPRDIEEGEDAAAALLERMAATPIGLRIGPDGVAGPLLGPRLLADGAALALSALPHARASRALVGMLAGDLDAVGAPRWAGMYAAIDVAASRFRDGPPDAACCAADLAGLGLIVLGRRRPMGSARLAPRAAPIDVADALEPAIAAARRLGGLPAGTLLMVAGLAPPVAPALGTTLDWGFGAALGRVRASFPAPDAATLAPT
ncbi:hypothetical protein [Plastoroseomonas arctica]|uniref:Uncharacterized protein n=1 Tax=Plastoroseomonas arctica TaxID=1509237 RepID=A0AAF1JXL1_9PROT|nr:hypothetical protein [Plastoroseomonas arctica]MBR0656266.1 hypothetical protein [Plastoroseomonas arctica]